jgi:hypothetical protein
MPVSEMPLTSEENPPPPALDAVAAMVTGYHNYCEWYSNIRIDNFGGYSDTIHYHHI